LLCSGDPDPHVPRARVEESAGILSAMDAAVTTKHYPGRPAARNENGYHVCPARPAEQGKRDLTAETQSPARGCHRLRHPRPCSSTTARSAGSSGAPAWSTALPACGPVVIHAPPRWPCAA
jgi:hypothetical protein